MIHTPECQANCPCCGGDWDCNCGAITFPPVPVAHDALCPWRVAEESDSALKFLAGVAVCECDLIAKVRQDMLAKCITAVEYLHDYEAQRDRERCDALWNAIAALRDLREKR